MPNVPLTIFSVPKPFEGHIDVIQRNALRNWRSLGLEVVLLGAERGAAEAAAEVGARLIAEVARSPQGTPLLNSVFATAKAAARTPRIMFSNGDILFPPTFLDALAAVPERPFLGIGRRVDTDVTESYDFASGWPAALDELVRRTGQLNPAGIDYFAMERASPLTCLPPFAVGRPGWDQWMVREALDRLIPVIDLTDGVAVVHQNHTYAHVPQRQGPRWEGPEADANLAIMQGRFVNINDSSYRMDVRRRIRPVRPKLGHLWFEAGYASRFTNRTQAVRCYLRSFLYQPRPRPLLAAAKLAVPTVLAQRLRRPGKQ